MARTGDREIRSVSGRLPDKPGELACMLTMLYVPSQILLRRATAFSMSRIFSPLRN